MEIALVVIVVLAVLAFFFLKKKPEEHRADAPRTAPAQKEIPARDQPLKKQGSSPPAAADSHKPLAQAAGDEDAAATDELLVEEQLDDTAAAADEASPPPPPTRTGSTPDSTSLGRPVELQSLRKGLAKSRDTDGFFGRLKGLFGGAKEIDPQIAEEIEEVLLTSDVGVKTTETILERIKESLSKGDLRNEAQVWEALRQEARRTLSVDGRSGGITLGHKPTVVLLAGVNGAGKTTTIGKLAQQFSGAGKKVMLAAGDTFRAAAVDQLKAWGERVGCEVIAGKEGADPSSVLFDAIQAARDSGADVLLADTAGRLHTKTNLMQEMTKIAKTAGKALPGAPHEVLLVIDSTNGQNALAQAREFKEALDITGLVLTKLDGTARGGAVLGICDGLQVPVRYIGVGERTEDLYEFDTDAFVEALLGGSDEEIAA
jgi:fused signal recognition particle receptor